MEEETFQWLNRARTNPLSLVVEFKELLSNFDGKELRDPRNNTSVMTVEGPEAVYEAIAYVKTLGQLHPLRLSKGLTQASRDHCYDIGPAGGASHAGSDGSSMAERIEKYLFHLQRYGRWHRAISENISFNELTGKNIILQFIIDDGNESRSHRKNIFNPEYSDFYHSYSFVGIGCGFHKSFDLICVMDLAGSYEDHLEMLQNRGGDRRTKQLPNQGNPAPQPSNRNTFYDSPRKQQGDVPNSMNAINFRVDEQQREFEPKHLGKRIESDLEQTGKSSWKW